MVAFVLYESMLVARQIVFTQGHYEQGRLLFEGVSAFLLTGLVILTLSRPRIRQAFVRNNDNDVKELGGNDR